MIDYGFHSNAQVLISTNKTRRIADIQVGQKILALNKEYRELGNSSDIYYHSDAYVMTEVVDIIRRSSQNYIHFEKYSDNIETTMGFDTLYISATEGICNISDVMALSDTMVYVDKHLNDIRSISTSERYNMHFRDPIDLYQIITKEGTCIIDSILCYASYYCQSDPDNFWIGQYLDI